MSSNEEEIKDLCGRWKAAVEKMDVDAIMALYADDVTVFDVPPPHRIKGKAAYREHWEHWFKNFTGPLTCEFKDMEITAGDDVAFVTTLTKISEASVPNSGAWVRVTVGYRKIGGNWLATHEHASIPAGMGN